jgi:hypothetical protein
MEAWFSIPRTTKPGRSRRRDRRVGAALGMAALTLSTVVSTASAAEADTDVPSPARGLITLEMSECDLMYLGTGGSCIISLQTWMNWAVGDKTHTTPIDGLYGQDTLALVKTFQSRYVPEIVPNGKFGTKSRAALKRWFVQRANTPHNSDHLPCNPALGWGCESGAAVEGLNLKGKAKIGKTLVCMLVGKATMPVGVICSVYFD